MYYEPITALEPPVVEAGYLPDNVDLHFVFGAHAVASDFDAPAAFLKESDIFIPELVGWNDDTLDWLRRVSKSNPTNFDKLMRGRSSLFAGGRIREFRDYFYKLTCELQGKNVTVLLVDSNNEDETAKTMISAAHEKPPLNLEDEPGRLYSHMHLLVETSFRREATILKNLGPLVTRAVTEHPRLVKKDVVQVLVVLGAEHQRVYDHLSDSKPVANQVRASYGVSYQNDEPVERKHQAFDKIMNNEPLARDEIAAVWIGLQVNSLIQRTTALKGLGPDDLSPIRNRLFRLLTQDVNLSTAEVIYRFINGQSRSDDEKRLEKYAEIAGI